MNTKHNSKQDLRVYLKQFLPLILEQYICLSNIQLSNLFLFSRTFLPEICAFTSFINTYLKVTHI